MRRSYVWFVVLLACVLVLPFGSVPGLVLLLVLGFAIAVAYAARADLLDRGAPDWAWMVVGVVSLALTPLGGFVLWMLARGRWRKSPLGADPVGAATDL